ncbi:MULTISPECIES: threonine ammonia-lyase [Methylobacterium]|uniref:threonine ammonia-lyase n=1 Tax=Methylobacterium TaxID=407 RepID=UPI0013EA9B78|nr:threonine ammonia-lyase [Methylobacterium sp. DB0501]NGM32365.1 threonine ammonia-lyase [Methylobacterium sp. DB0501]
MSQPYAITPDDVVRASHTIRGHVLRTPLVPAPRLSELTGARVLVKHENMQATGAFKERGAVNRLNALTAPERRRGVVAMSAGNHAQAVAYHAHRLGIPATIVMPATTPLVKVENTRAHGATVVLEGETLVESAACVDRLVAAHGFVLVHPYDDPLVMAGQGTIALEMLEDAPDLDCLVVPIGGGGLMSGIAMAASLRPRVGLYGVEAALYPSFLNAIDGQDRPIGGPTLAEGIAVKTVGRLTLPIIRDMVREIVLVDEPQIERAVHDYATLQRSLAEGAGAAGLAALLARPDLFSGRTVGLVLCGGNIDARLLASVMVRELEREDRIISFRMTASDRPGVLGRVAGRLGELGANILEVSHGRLHLDVPAKSVSIDVTIETRGPGHTAEILDTLRREGLEPRRIGSVGTAATGG